MSNYQAFLLTYQFLLMLLECLLISTDHKLLVVKDRTETNRTPWHEEALN